MLKPDELENNITADISKKMDMWCILTLEKTYQFQQKYSRNDWLGYIKYILNEISRPSPVIVNNQLSTQDFVGIEKQTLVTLTNIFFELYELDAIYMFIIISSITINE